LLDGKLFLAPIDSNPQQVLDVGTGTGIWAMYFSFPAMVRAKLTKPATSVTSFLHRLLLALICPRFSLRGKAYPPTTWPILTNGEPKGCLKSIPTEKGVMPAPETAHRLPAVLIECLCKVQC
jgi:hypothetical protein